MKRALFILCLLPSVCFSQGTNRPVSMAVTQTVIAITGGPVESGLPPGLGQAFGQFVNASYLWVATNGQVSVGLGNTLKDIGHGSLKMVTTESVDLPAFTPTNSFVDINFEVITSQFYAPDKTHLGIGPGVYTVWRVGWLAKWHLLIFQNLQGFSLGVGIEPDVDKTIALKFDRADTVVEAKAGLKWTF